MYVCIYMYTKKSIHTYMVISVLMKETHGYNLFRDAVTAAIADDAAWLKEKDELILKHNEGKMEE